MKAIVYTQYGGPEVLHLAEVPKPSPADNEVLIKVYAVSVNDWDWGLLQKDLFNRLMSGFTKPRRQTIGSDVAGRVEAVGKNVMKFKVGDDVYGDLSGQWGGFAEYVCANENLVASKPAAMSFAEAAAIPQAGMLAVQGLIDKGRLHSGKKLLINGAGGGVGTLGLQIANSLGVQTDVVDSAEKLEMLRTLGAVDLIDYKKEDFTRRGKRYDVILDTKTNRSVLSYLRALNPNGMYITVGGHLSRLFQSLFLMPLISLFSNKKVTIVALKPNKDLEYMNSLFEEGKLKPVIHPHHYTLEDAPEAMKLFGNAEHKGKVIITVSR